MPAPKTWNVEYIKPGSIGSIFDDRDAAAPYAVVANSWTATCTPCSSAQGLYVIWDLYKKKQDSFGNIVGICGSPDPCPSSAEGRITFTEV